jgi:copper chaperone CopZ
MMKQNAGGLHPVGNAIFSLYTLGCSSCSGLELKLKKVPGIAEVNVNYAADIVQVKFDPSKVTIDDIRTFMKKLGYANALGH